MPGLDFFPIPVPLMSMQSLRGSLPKGLPVGPLCLCSQGFRTKHARWQQAPSSRHLCCSSCGLEVRMSKIWYLSSLAGVPCFCPFQLGIFICSNEGSFFYYRSCNLKCIFSRKSWTVAVQSTLLIKPEWCLIHFDSMLLPPVIFVTAGILVTG